MRLESCELEQQAVLATASKMCAAARTAPKGHGVDYLHTLVLTGAEKDLLADQMDAYGETVMGAESWRWYGRDAKNVRNSGAVVLIGIEKIYKKVPNCGFCGYENCAACVAAGGNCAHIYTDLGIALGSAVSVAADDRVDNRIMFSIAKTVMHYAEHYGKDIVWLGIPLSVTGKDIYHDRGIVHD